MSEVYKVSRGIPVKPVPVVRRQGEKDKRNSAREHREKAPAHPPDRPQGHVDRYV